MENTPQQLYSSLEKAQQRKYKRLDPDKALKPAEVNSLSDIKAVLRAFDPRNRDNRELDPVEVSTLLRGEDEEGVMRTYSVSAETTSKSKRDILIEGMEVVRKRFEASKRINEAAAIDINGVEMKPASIANDYHTWVDPLIKHWLGGLREGLYIYWDIGDGYKYKYDPFEHKLTRLENDR